MSGRISRLFWRYAARHMHLSRPGPVLRDALGAVTGRIETISLHNDRLVVIGQCAAEQVTLNLGGRRRMRVPNAAGGSGFRLELPFTPGEAQFSQRLGGENHGIALPGFSPRRLALARLALLPRFGLDGLRAMPSALRWLRYHDIAARMSVKRMLGLGALVEEMQLEPALLPATPPEHHPPATSIRILLPVYDAFGLLPEVLDRILRHTDLPWHLTLIEDASPDTRVRPFLRTWAEGKPTVTLLENDHNLGFIGTMNRGFAHLMGQGGTGPVVMLNSDAFVPQGWASRLVAPLLADPGVASVTPMSNDAELMSVPVICQRRDLGPGAVDQIDAVARHFGSGPDILPEAPTGVGFCMALNPEFLTQVPEFDVVFGRGYGEEVDWCQRVRRLGGRHLCLPGLFVEHRGGASFGSAAKQALILQNGARISARYPLYDAEVQQFIADDPLVTARLALGLAWAGTLQKERPVPLYLAHGLGGGAEVYLQDRLHRDLRRVGAAVVLRVGGEYRWEISLCSPGGITRGATDDRDLMLRLLALLPRRRVIYSCGVSDPDPVELPEVLLALSEGQRLEVLVHDYLPISPRYTLLDQSGAFRGAPRVGGAVPGRGHDLGRGHEVRRPDGRWVDLAGWQAAWRPLLMAADEIVVFSGASQALMATAYPDLGDRLVMRPHHLPLVPPRLTPPASGRLVIGVLGNLGFHKGAEVVVSLSQHLARQKAAAGLVLIGNIDPTYDLTAPAKVHGSYEPRQVADLATHYGVSCWLIPSIWPETFSYTTHEVLATGLPVLCFDLGAQAEALRAAMAEGAQGALLPLPEGRGDPETILAAARKLCARP